MEPNYLKQSYFFLRSNFSTLLAIQLPFIVGLIIFKQMFVGEIDEDANIQRALFMMTGLDLLFVPIYLASTILYMQSVLEKKPLSVLGAWVAGIRSWVRLFFTFLLSAILISIGMMLLILPGIYAAVRLVIANAICVLEGKGPIDSMRQSWNVTADHFWLLFKGLAIIYGGLFGAELLIAPLVSDSSIAATAIQSILDFCNIFGTIFAFRVYCAWRDGELIADDTGS